MHSTPFFDLAGQLPPNVGAQLNTPRFAAHAVHLASGMAAFSMRDELPEALELSGCDSDTRLHFSLWLRGDIEAHSAVSALRVRAGQAVNALLPGVPWRICYHAGGLHNIGLLLSPHALVTLAGDAGHGYLAGMARKSGLDVVTCDARVLRAAYELDTVLFDDGSPPLLREAKMLELLARLLQASACAVELPRCRQNHLAQARERLLADPARAPSIAELARACGINSCSLKRDFKALYGMSIHALHQQQRMMLAWRLIESGECTVSEAGEQVGYSSLSHFSTAFRKAFGLLPSALRRRAHVAVAHAAVPPQKS